MNMSIKKVFITIGVIAVIAIGVFVYLNNASKKQEVKVGVILPLTGAASEIGNDILDGIKIATDYYNQNSERKVTLIIEDSKLEAKNTISATHKLIDVDKVVSIMGLASSTEALSAAPICEKSKVVMISATASTPNLTDAGDYVFRIYPSDVYDGKILADFSNSYELKTISILYLNNDFGVGLKDAFIENYIKSGGKIGLVESFSPDDVNFKTQLTKIKQNNADGLLMIAIDMQYLNIVKQIRELKIVSQLLAPVTFDNPVLVEKLGDAANGIIYTRPKYNLDINSLESIYLKEKYKQIKNTAPPLLTSLGFDTFSLLFKSLKEENFDASKIKDYLYQINFDGVAGHIQFDKNGDIISEIETMIIINNKTVRYDAEN
jgi:branched-chain amino acid transport system substrate-binding protein